MAELIYRIPSKVPYGYVEIKYSAEDLVDVLPDLTPEAVADDYIRVVTRYRDMEEKALTAPNSAPPKSKPPIVQPIDDVLSQDDAADLIKSKLGATEVDGEDDAPWNNKPEAEEKPYVTPASEDAWDF